MGFFEEQRGLAPGVYSAELLALEADAGRWLLEQQQKLPIQPERHPRWDLDLEQKALLFGDEASIAVVARVEVIGTFSASDGVWLWAWANPRLQPMAEAIAAVREEHSAVPEMSAPSFPCNEIQAWALAAVASRAMSASGCNRLPTGEVNLFVALFDVVELSPDDPRARRPGGDPTVAARALAEYAGPMALYLGARLLEASGAGGEAGELDPVLSETQRFCERLDRLGVSAIGQGTPAGAEAAELAALLRQGTLCLQLPASAGEAQREARDEALGELLALLHAVATRYSAAPGSETTETGG